MDRSLRRVGVAMMVLVVLLIGNASWVQVVHAGAYRSDPLNRRGLLEQYSRPRGLILDSAGNTIASVRATNDELKFQRVYSDGPLYAPVTGYLSVDYGSTGIEHAEESVLDGSDDSLFVHRLGDLIAGRASRGGDVQLTINPAVQKAAYAALTSRGLTGAAVAIQPTTGRVLAMVSTPSFDPNPLASHSGVIEAQSWKSDISDPAQPMVNRAIGDPLPPGSTFKLIDASAALMSGQYGPGSQLTAAAAIILPGTTTRLTNYGGEHCGPGGDSTVTMTTALALSCNTAFATLTAQLGQQALTDQAAKYGVSQRLSIPMPVTDSTLGPISSQSALYHVGIGQQSVQFTPLQSAMITATIANGGTRMKPQLVENILAPDRSRISGFNPQQQDQATSSQVASQIIGMMKQSEKDMDTNLGQAQYLSYDIASKTGTAEHGAQPKTTVPYGWYTALAPASNPQIAVSVVITGGSPYGLNTVGATVAGPIGHAMIQALLRSPTAN
jgi:penicillin-binding protein A